MDNSNNEPMFDENGELIGISVPAMPVGQVVFGAFNSDGTVTPRYPIKKTVAAWECPACGVGVRGDVKVCPNCVKNKTEFKVKDASKQDEPKTLISELRDKGVGRKY